MKNIKISTLLLIVLIALLAIFGVAKASPQIPNSTAAMWVQVNETEFGNMAIKNVSALEVFGTDIYLPIILNNFPPDIDPDTSLLLHMNEGPGATSFYDASGNGNHGFCSGDACPTSGVAGVFGNALSFDGVDDYVQVNDSALPSGSAARTMAFWMKPEFDARIPVTYGNPEPSGAYYVLVNNDNACIGQMNGGPLEVCGSTNIIDGNWHFVAMTYDGVDSVLLYLDDGVLEASVTKTYNTTLTGELWVGRLTYEYYSGHIDELVIYNRALSVGEIKTLYASGP